MTVVAARDLNAKSLNLIKEVEGWRACTYKDVANKLTIGYGHLIVSRDGFKAGSCISKEQGEQLLKSDIKTATNCIGRLVKKPLTDNQFGALTSWAYNVGCGNAASSTLVRKLNEGNKNVVCSQLKTWRKAGGKVNQGLINRRYKECKLFSS
ncbi:uncharacterized protein LOC116350899 [Contarinia nasturtii]|uniref:uncharacterized protein LOC116350899 n=1 Tax=Contarinia nasturtii TaxID=265458 RepID=UPI0012D38DB3|nr:uncharacterized protein LOC116350899 [Contarinia nasturtii]